MERAGRRSWHRACAYSQGRPLASHGGIRACALARPAGAGVTKEVIAGEERVEEERKERRRKRKRGVIEKARC